MQAGEIRVARVGSGLGRRYGTGRLVPSGYVPGLAERLAAGGGARHKTGGRHRLSSRRSKVGIAERKLKETRTPVPFVEIVSSPALSKLRQLTQQGCPPSLPPSYSFFPLCDG
jgi:hypothetical protein